MKDKIVRSRIVRLDSGRESYLSGSESDMSTVHARSKICPCLPPCTRTRIVLGSCKKSSYPSGRTNKAFLPPPPSSLEVVGLKKPELKWNTRTLCGQMSQSVIQSVSIPMYKLQFHSKLKNFFLT